MMQTIQKVIFLEKSSLYFLPMNDMDTTDMNCIYSTLCFVTSQSTKKYTIIIQSEPADSELCSIVLKLMGFHAQILDVSDT